MRDPIIYVGHAVTHGSPHLQALVTDFKRALRESTDAVVLEWVHKDRQVEDFYARDLGNVHMADLIVMFVDEPSTGMGMEIQEAIIMKKTVLGLSRHGVAISRLLTSAAEVGHVQLAQYADLEEATAKTLHFIAAAQGRSTDTGAR